MQSDPIGLLGGFSTYAYAGGNPVVAFDPRGLDIAVIEQGPTLGNPIGHTAIAVTGSGVYSSGNNLKCGSSLKKYLQREAPRRNQTIYVLKTTPAEDAAALAILKKNCTPGEIPKTFGNCSDRSNDALDAAGVENTAASNAYPGSAGARAEEAGATAYDIPQLPIPQAAPVIPTELQQFEPRGP